jgi:hypothetical protein
MKRNIFVRGGGMVAKQSYVAEPLELAIARKLNNGDSLNDRITLTYSEDNGVVPSGTNIREDRFDIAVEARSKVEASKQLSAKMTVVKDDNDEAVDTAVD